MLPIRAVRGRAGVHTFFCIDGHTCGNPVRLVAGGAPLLRGATMSARRQDFLARFDWIRTALMFEPRGHDIMSGAILYPPCRDDCDTGILYIEVTGCLPMCGHGTIGSVTFALEQGLVSPRTEGSCGSTRRPASWSPTTSARALRRARPADQRAELSGDARGARRLPGARRAGGRHRLWRQFLCDRRAAAELSPGSTACRPATSSG